MGCWAGLAGAKFKVGQYLTCVVEEVKSNGGVVSLSVEHSEVSSAFATEEQSWNLNNLLPGLLVKAQVQKVSRSFLLFYKGEREEEREGRREGDLPDQGGKLLYHPGQLNSSPTVSVLCEGQAVGSSM